MSGKNKTFRPSKSHEPGTKRFELHKKAKETLGSGGNLADAVKLPAGEELNDWLATNTVDFYNHTNVLYGTITDSCTIKTCPKMSAGTKFEYLWSDGNSAPVECSAPEYVDHLMKWIEKQLDDASIFPQTADASFSKDFRNIVKKIFTRLFRVYAHMYYSHFKAFQELGAEAHLNTTFKHFHYFINEFDLVEKPEQAPLEELVNSLITK